jgi:uncharacterized protein (DUF1810 family)
MTGSRALAACLVEPGEDGPVEDPFDLERFVTAQTPAYPAVVAELRMGRKRSHWMWFVFPQLRGLGSSPTSQYYGLASLDEATAYAAHPVLGARLRECTDLVLAIEGRGAEEIFGFPDELKLRSSMTLFSVAVPNESRFSTVLERFYGGELDPRTLELLRVG